MKMIRIPAMVLASLALIAGCSASGDLEFVPDEAPEMIVPEGDNRPVPEPTSGAAKDGDGDRRPKGTWLDPEGEGVTLNVPTLGAQTTCLDVTSYDYDWDNDMLCTRPDGSKFYTDYAGAAQYE